MKKINQESTLGIFSQLEKVVLNTLIVAMTIGLMACSTSVPVVELNPNANPSEELAAAEKQLQQLDQQQYSQLSPGMFANAKESLSDAKSKIQKGKPSQESLKDIGQALGYLKTVQENGDKYSKPFETVMAARQSSIEAGAQKLFPQSLKKVDEDLQDEGEDIEKGNYVADAKTVDSLEKSYRLIELDALKSKNLGESKALIDNAEKEGAKKNAPQSLASAKALYETAIRSIDVNRKFPSAYDEAVMQSINSAKKLSQVNEIAKKNKSSEAVALTIYSQNLQLQSSRESISKMSDRNKAAMAKLNDLSIKNEQYKDKEEFEQKISQLTKKFQPNEAEVLQEDHKMIVRLKNIHFDIARSEVKPDSYGTLEKVKALIVSVPEANVVVEGHTDSTGSVAANKNLSEQRAESVKKYFMSQNVIPEERISSEGFGYEKPLATNKTKEGRATNRRVDIVIDSKSKNVF